MIYFQAGVSCGYCPADSPIYLSRLQKRCAIRYWVVETQETLGTSRTDLAGQGPVLEDSANDGSVIVVQMDIALPGCFEGRRSNLSEHGSLELGLRCKIPLNLIMNTSASR